MARAKRYKCDVCGKRRVSPLGAMYERFFTTIKWPLDASVAIKPHGHHFCNDCAFGMVDAAVMGVVRWIGKNT